MMAVMVGIKSSKHSCTRYAGTGSSMHDLCGALRMMFFTCCSVTREGFKSGTTEDREVRLSRRSIKLIPQSLNLSREEISKRIWEINSGDGAWEGAVLLLARQLICDVEEIFASRTALDLVAHVVLLCLQEEFLHLLAVVAEDLSVHSKSSLSPAPFSTSSSLLRLLDLHCK